MAQTDNHLQAQTPHTDLSLANNLNDFYDRFERQREVLDFIPHLQLSRSCSPFTNSHPLPSLGNCWRPSPLFRRRRQQPLQEAEASMKQLDSVSPSTLKRFTGQLSLGSTHWLEICWVQERRHHPRRPLDWMSTTLSPWFLWWGRPRAGLQTHHRPSPGPPQFGYSASRSVENVALFTLQPLILPVDFSCSQAPCASEETCLWPPQTIGTITESILFIPPWSPPHTWTVWETCPSARSIRTKTPAPSMNQWPAPGPRPEWLMLVWKTKGQSWLYPPLLLSGYSTPSSAGTTVPSPLNSPCSIHSLPGTGVATVMSGEMEQQKVLH